MAIPGEVIEARAGWTDGLRDRLPPGAHVVVVGARSMHCLEGRQAGLAFRDTIAVATEQGFTFAALFRVPFEGTVAEQVMKTGTGALWIDGCRIQGKYNDTELRPNARRHVKTKFNEVYGAYDLSADKCTSDLGYHNSLGRWPTNLVLVHGLGCRCEGTKRVKGSNVPTQTPEDFGKAGRFSLAKGTQRTGPLHYADADGTETVTSWICEPGCPVAVLNVTGGERRSSCGGGNQTGAKGGTGIGFNRLDATGHASTQYSDSGGASRFYPQFPDRSAFIAWIERLIYGGSGASPSSTASSSSPT
jgi:hypothetical protein